MSSIFDLPGFKELYKELAKDGTEIAGDVFFWYDEEHAKKVTELLQIDNRYFYYIQLKCGIDLEDESYNGPDQDLRIVNFDHFAVKKSAVKRAEEFKKLIYDTIDYVYAHKDELDLDDLLWDEDGNYGDSYLEYLDSKEDF